MEVNQFEVEAAKRLQDAKDGKAFFELWIIDNADTDDAGYPRVGIVRGSRYDPQRKCYIRFQKEEAAALYKLLCKESSGTEWAMCYDDPPYDKDKFIEFTNDRGLPRQYALSYSGRYWEVCPEQADNYCMDTIYQYCMNDTGAVHYFEKEGSAWHSVM